MNTDKKKLILKELIQNKNLVISGEELSKKLGITRQGIFKIITGLRKEGFNISSLKSEGYSLSDTKEDLFSPDLTEMLLNKENIFKKIYYCESVESTQKSIKKIINKHTTEAVVLMAEEQTGGRGRLSRVWSSCKNKDLTFSMLLHPELKPSQIQLLNLYIGVILKKLIETKYNLKCELKWPNDILIKGKKVAGILSEAAGEPDKIYYAVCGIGINLNSEVNSFPETIRYEATSIRLETGCIIDRSRFLADFLNLFSENTENFKSEKGIKIFLDEYRSLCDTLNRDVTVTDGENITEGKAVKITDDGSIVVRIKNYEKIFSAADIKHIRKK